MYLVFYTDHYERNIETFDTITEAENFVCEIEARSDGIGGGTGVMNVFEVKYELKWQPVEVVTRLVLVPKER